MTSGLAVYQREDYRQAGGLRIGSFVGRLARAAVGAATGGISGAIGAVLSRPTARPGGSLTLGGGPMPVLRTPGFTGAMQRLIPGGATGYQVGGRKMSRRMNAGNGKAARRAIRRIKAVRHMLMAIEREMPRRPALKSTGSKRCSCK